MPDRSRCPECGSQLAEDAPQGLCPRCLMMQALADSEDLGRAIGPIDMNCVPTVAGVFDPHAPDFGHGLFTDLVESTLTPGQQFGAYRIQRLLGKGGMGEVYEAYHAPSSRWVAIKILNQELNSEEDRRRFLREGHLAASISHPHCVYVFGTEEIEGIPTIVMELAPEGTINQLVKRTGPVPLERAIEMSLQLIDGLQAALAAGVLHRDIKPSNCFLDSQGRVKVGDFGLSITTLAKEASQLTLTGSFIGTPVFASPEQLRGDRLDVRSDIYSLGVTMYYMLTGTIPFEADTMVKLISTVLEQSPQPPSILRPQIPKALSQVIMRCLEKSPEKRFASYEALRSALQPFCSGVPLPAAPTKRFVAGFIDNVVLTVFGFYPIMLISTDFNGAGISDSSTKFMPKEIFASLSAIQLEFMALCILYYAVLEGLWGASVGKAIMRIRVCNLNGGTPGFLPALLRSAIVNLVPLIVMEGAIQFPGVDYSNSQSINIASLTAWCLSMVSFALLFSTMRTRNGLAAIHGLASKTRVVTKPSYVSEPRIGSTKESGPEPGILAHVGPYGALTAIPSDDSEHVIPGYDPVLRRNVWLHLLPIGTPQLPAQRRDVSRHGRIRWINGLRTAEQCWDAYEAPDGKPFLDAVSTPQPWKTVRLWILDIAEELRAAEEEGSLPPSLSVDRIWITAQERAKLLDFLAPGTEQSQQDKQATAPGEFQFEAMQQFLSDFAWTALRGASQHKPVTPVASFGLPVHAVDFLAQVGQNGYRNTQSVLDAIRAAVTGPAAITWRRRLTYVSFLAVIPALISCGSFAGALAYLVPNYLAYERQPELLELTAALQVLQAADHEAQAIDGAAENARVVEEMKKLEIYISGRFRETIEDPEVRSNMFSGLQEGAQTRKLADQALANYPSPTKQEVASAAQLVRPSIEKQLNDMGGKPKLANMFFYFSAGLLFMPLLLFGMAAPIMAMTTFLTRGGILFRAFGLALVAKNGQQVSRLRALWRSLIACSPGWFALIGFFFVRGGIVHSGDLKIVPILFAIFFAGTIYAVAAKRSIQDLLAGTYLVIK